ncbi:MAG: hypothetical protein ACYC5X_06375, partial [Syntrophales bacterium]
TGLTLAGLMLPSPFGHHPAAYGAPASVRIDRAVAWALEDAGVKVVTHVPATGATAIFDAYNGLMGVAPCYAFNEELAFTMAHGAALAGARSAAVIKSHGLAKAANSVIDSLTLGTTAGFVAVVLDDPAGRHSDNIFALEDFLKGTGMPFKKAGRDTVYADLLECFLWSEELKTPVALFVDSDLVLRETACERRVLRPSEAQYRRDPLRHVLCPRPHSLSPSSRCFRSCVRRSPSPPVTRACHLSSPSPPLPASMPAATMGEASPLPSASISEGSGARGPSRETTLFWLRATWG